MTDTLDAVRSGPHRDPRAASRPPRTSRPTPRCSARCPSSTRSACVALVGALEDRFDITIDDDEFGAELFETVGSLTEFVDAKLS